MVPPLNVRWPPTCHNRNTRPPSRHRPRKGENSQERRSCPPFFLDFCGMIAPWKLQVKRICNQPTNWLTDLQPRPFIRERPQITSPSFTIDATWCHKWPHLMSQMVTNGLTYLMSQMASCYVTNYLTEVHKWCQMWSHMSQKMSCHKWCHIAWHLFHKQI